MGQGLQRAANAASDAARRTTGKPSKPWRVFGGDGGYTDYRGQKAAYEAVRELTGHGHTATVWQWYRSGWGLYEVIEPDPEGTE